MGSIHTPTAGSHCEVPVPLVSIVSMYTSSPYSARSFSAPLAHLRHSPPRSVQKNASSTYTAWTFAVLLTPLHCSLPRSKYQNLTSYFTCCPLFCLVTGSPDMSTNCCTAGHSYLRPSCCIVLYIHNLRCPPRMGPNVRCTRMVLRARQTSPQEGPV